MNKCDKLDLESSFNELCKLNIKESLDNIMDDNQDV